MLAVAIGDSDDPGSDHVHITGDALRLTLTLMRIASTYEENFHVLFPKIARMVVSGDWEHLKICMLLLELFIFNGGSTFLNAHALDVNAMFCKTIGAVKTKAASYVRDREERSERDEDLELHSDLSCLPTELPNDVALLRSFRSCAPAPLSPPSPFTPLPPSTPHPHPPPTRSYVMLGMDALLRRFPLEAGQLLTANGCVGQVLKCCYCVVKDRAEREPDVCLMQWMSVIARILLARRTALNAMMSQEGSPPAYCFVIEEEGAGGGGDMDGEGEEEDDGLLTCEALVRLFLEKFVSPQRSASEAAHQGGVSMMT
jgi:hypothetical protein